MLTLENCVFKEKTEMKREEMRRELFNHLNDWQLKKP